MRSLAPAVLCALAPLVSCSTPSPREVLEIQEDAWNRGDLETFVEEGYLDSPTLTFYGANPPTVGYEALLERYRAGYQEGDAEMGQLEFSRLDVQQLGDEHALGRGQWQLTFEDGSTAGGWFTLIFVETEDGWRIMHDHTSAREEEQP